MRRSATAWLLVLLGAVAAAAMLPQFAIFVPIVAAAWILARFGLFPSFLYPSHPGARLAAGADAPLTWLSATLESDAGSARVEQDLLARVLARADAVAGERVPGAEPGLVAWGQTTPRPETALACLEATLVTWPDLRAPLASGARAALSIRTTKHGRHRRIEACLAGDRAVIGRLALDAAAELRGCNVEVVTTGWLRHEERLHAARTRPRA